MEMSIHTSRSDPEGECFWRDSRSIDVERELLAAGSRLKSVVSSWLLGEISGRQFDLLRTELLQRIRVLAEGAPRL